MALPIPTSNVRLGSRCDLILVQPWSLIMLSALCPGVLPVLQNSCRNHAPDIMMPS